MRLVRRPDDGASAGGDPNKIQYIKMKSSGYRDGRFSSSRSTPSRNPDATS